MGACGLAILLLPAALGCRDVSPAVASANYTRDLGHASALALHGVCTLGYERAATEADVDRLDRLGCVKAAHAHDALRAAHGVLVSVISAIDAGECARVVTAPRSCDLAGAIRGVIRASATMALAVRDIQEASR